MAKKASTKVHKTTQLRCVDCDYYHLNDPDYPDNCEYPDYPPCNYE